MKLELAPRAVREAERSQRWWREHRPSASDLFEQELREALALIRSAPLSGTVYRVSGRLEHRRALLAGTRNHVYYRVVDTETVRVLAVWSAVRGRGPRI